MHALHSSSTAGGATHSEFVAPRKYTVGPYAAFLFLAALAFAGAGVNAARAATAISQFGITWTFDRDYPSGQFANGDYWVVGPVKIVEISPRSETTDGRTINGSMINPAVGSLQGYDSAAYAESGPSYSAALNVALGVSAAAPLTVPAGSSLISSISEPVAGNRPQLRAAAILTVLAGEPPAGSFRPPYCGTDKTPYWNKNQLDYSRLRSLPKPDSLRDLHEVEGYFERPWLEQNTIWTGRYLHPTENQPDFGRDMANCIGEALISLQMDYTVAEKETLLIRFVQYGLDVYGVAKAGGVWLPNGAHNQGRKMPLLLAGTVLSDGDILAYGDAAKHFIFQEDMQTWYVTEADVGRPVYSGTDYVLEPYIAADVGLAEWGAKHAVEPFYDGRNWDAPSRLMSGRPMVGHALVAHLMGLQSAWNWPAFFDYYDRFWEVEKENPAGGGSGINASAHIFWSAYRWYTIAPSVAAHPEDRTAVTGGTVTFEVVVAGTDPLSYQWLKDGVPIAGEKASALTLTNLTKAQAGDYSVTVSNPAGSAVSETARLVVVDPSRLINASVRGLTRSDASPLIVGFVVGGSGRSLLVRAIGPSLAPLGVKECLPDPRINLFETIEERGQIVASNDNWGDSNREQLRAAAAAVGASLEDASLDAALVAHVAGARTVHAIDTGGRSGITLVDLFDLDTDPENRIVNISARNFVGSGDQVLIAGFIVSGEAPKRLLIRGVGPGLARFDVPGRLGDPRIDVHTNRWEGNVPVDTIVASNDDWSTGGVAEMQAAFELTRAFPLPDASTDAALIVELPVGIYTVVLTGKGDETGEALIEVYEIP
ncbi:MAG TPA: immunoglobulin domain-containing protein [Opitutaceae bacterium]